MISALLSFFAGNAFRMMFGEFTAWMNAKQEHKFELERMTLQGSMASAEHARNQEAIRLQAELGIKTIQVQGDADLSQVDASVFGQGVELTGKLTGIKWVDAWNQSIRPALASVCMLLWVLHVSRQNWALDDQGWALVGAALGIFVADRTLMKRGK
jgi:hypothetical protein